MARDTSTLDEALPLLVERLLARRDGVGWTGHLASSALSTATGMLALALVGRARGEIDADTGQPIDTARGWLVRHQNADGGWGDTDRSRSNISTTAIAWASLSYLSPQDPDVRASAARAEGWLRTAAGDVTPEALRGAILKRYGKDRTFSVPILTVLALAGKLGDEPATAWRRVPQLPFELAALPHRLFQYLRLPVVSYALPALIAIGQVRHHRAPTRNPLTRAWRTALRARTHGMLVEMQPSSGGYLEAAPLTSFVMMSLARANLARSPVIDAGMRFLLQTQRPDGSWPIDTNLATWVTTLSVGALGEAGGLARVDAEPLRDWLLRQQGATEHPFTHAAPGAWAWTPLSGGVPDADDTAGALLALLRLGPADARAVAAAAAGVRWLRRLQNRDGGIPTFCRGWGALPFDRSTPELTAHALRAWSAWYPCLSPSLQAEVRQGASAALTFLERSQRPDGSWIPLWFGNENGEGEENPVYGTARVLLGLDSALVREDARARPLRERAVEWLLCVQNADGGWGGARGIAASIEETGVAVSALSRCAGGPEGPPRHPAGDRSERIRLAAARGASWLVHAVQDRRPAASPIGLYFARLWYYEELYPLIFAIEGLAAARATASTRTHPADIAEAI